MALNITQDVLQQLMEAAATAALNAQAANPTPNTANATGHDAGNAQNAEERDRRRRANLKRAERPEIDIGANESQWEFFVDEWNSYKRRTGLLPVEEVDELRASCSKELRKTLFDFVGSTNLQTITTDDLLIEIKRHAVVGKNKAVHRKEFYDKNQTPGEPINQYVAKLRSKAGHCNFTIKCTSDLCAHQENNYAEQMISDQMITGLYDKDIQEEILARDKQLTDFQARYDLIEAYELGKLAKNQLNTEESSLNASKSDYKKKRNGNKQKSAPCPGCMSTDHSALERSEKCPAWSKTCKKCGKPNHYAYACMGRTFASGKPSKFNASTADTGDSDPETSYFLSFSDEILESYGSALPHVQWDGSNFVKSKPPPLPRAKVSVSWMHDSHETFLKMKIPRSDHCPSVYAFTDTCAQTCISDVGILSAMGVDKKFLLPTYHGIIGVTGKRLEVIGAIMVTFKYNKCASQNIVYICNNVKGLFLPKKKHKLNLGC